MSVIDLLINIINPEMETKTETEIRMIWKLKLKRKSISKLKYNRNVKKPVKHKTVIETKLIFETEISLSPTSSGKVARPSGPMWGGGVRDVT